MDKLKKVTAGQLFGISEDMVNSICKIVDKIEDYDKKHGTPKPPVLIFNKGENMKLPKSKHKLGYTKKEILDIIRPLKIHHKTFWKKFGINTCALSETGEVLSYGCDIELAIRCCLEKRDKNIFEWD